MDRERVRLQCNDFSTGNVDDADATVPRKDCGSYSALVTTTNTHDSGGLDLPLEEEMKVSTDFQHTAPRAVEECYGTSSTGNNESLCERSSVVGRCDGVT
jgi:hypothetical protein